MAQLSPLPFQFTAGTPAVAQQVNDNFAAIRNHINGSNIDTINIASTLTSRAGAPILYLYQQTQNQIALSVENSQPNTAVQITQTALLDSGKAVLRLRDTFTQTTGQAELWLDLAANSTIPALLVNHGGVDTLNVTKTQLAFLNNSTQLTSTTLTTNKVILNAASSDATALIIKGRLSDNTSKVVLKSNDDLSTYATIESSSTKLSENIPTGSSYEFKINNVVKTAIDSNGIDGQYLKTTSIAKTKMVAVDQQIATPGNFSLNNISGYVDVTGATVTITTTGRPVLIIIDIGMWQMTNSGSGWENNNGYLKLVRDVTDLKVYKNRIVATDSNSYSSGLLLIESPMSAVYFDAVAAGTYTYKLQASADYQANPGQLNLNDIRLIAYEL